MTLEERLVRLKLQKAVALEEIHKLSELLKGWNIDLKKLEGATETIEDIIKQNKETEDAGPK